MMNRDRIDKLIELAFRAKNDKSGAHALDYNLRFRPSAMYEVLQSLSKEVLELQKMRDEEPSQEISPAARRMVKRAHSLGRAEGPAEYATARTDFLSSISVSGIRELDSKLKWYIRREASICEAIGGVADGGQYRNDITARLSKLFREHTEMGELMKELLYSTGELDLIGPLADIADYLNLPADGSERAELLRKR